MTLPAIELNSLEEQAVEPVKGSITAAATSDRAAMPGVIVLGGAHGSIAVARSLGRQGIPVWFVGADHPIARYSRYIRRRFRWNRFASDEAVELLCGLAQHEGAAGWVLFPSGDTEVQLVAQHWERLSKHFSLFTMPWETLQQLNDKSLLYKLAESVGAAFPRSYDPGANLIPGTDGFPLVIKPASTEKANTLTRDKAWRIETPAELHARFAEASALMGGGDHVVVQEMIPGGGESQFSYAGLWRHGSELAFLTARRTRQFPIDFGKTSSFVEVMEVPEIAEAARRLLSAVDFHGLVEIEFKFDRRDGAYKVLDANTRAWAWIGISANTGVDFPYLAWKLATGRNGIEGAVARPASWLFPARNLLSLLQQWRREGRPPLSAWRSMVASSTWATFAWDDPVPGIVEFPIQLTRLLRHLRLPGMAR